MRSCDFAQRHTSQPGKLDSSSNLRPQPGELACAGCEIAASMAQPVWRSRPTDKSVPIPANKPSVHSAETGQSAGRHGSHLRTEATDIPRRNTDQIPFHRRPTTQRTHQSQCDVRKNTFRQVSQVPEQAIVLHQSDRCHNSRSARPYVNGDAETDLRSRRPRRRGERANSLSATRNSRHHSVRSQFIACKHLSQRRCSRAETPCFPTSSPVTIGTCLITGTQIPSGINRIARYFQFDVVSKPVSQTPGYRHKGNAEKRVSWIENRLKTAFTNISAEMPRTWKPGLPGIFRDSHWIIRSLSAMTRPLTAIP